MTFYNPTKNLNNFHRGTGRVKKQATVSSPNIMPPPPASNFSLRTQRSRVSESFDPLEPPPVSRLHSRDRIFRRNNDLLYPEITRAS